MPYRDIENRRLMHRNWLEKNKEKTAAYNSSYRIKNRGKVAVNRKKAAKRIRRFIADAKTEKPCMDCGVIYPAYVMDFDHVRGNKDFELSKASKREISLGKIMAEIAKCDLVCANCHRIRTFTRGQQFGSEVKQEESAQLEIF
jgi:hypothetical protein